MFSFIDSASDHAAALSHFHSYALFFLILVIVFVVWLLKMILKFTVLERDTRRISTELLSARLPHVNFLTHLVYAFSFESIPLVAFSFDFPAAMTLIFNPNKVPYSYGMQKTIYPHQGQMINIFSVFPQLSFNSLAYNRPYTVNTILPHHFATASLNKRSLLNAFRTSLHSIPALFPFELVEVPLHGSYSSVEEYLTVNLYISTYISNFKNLAMTKYFLKPSTNATNWDLRMLDLKSSLGYTNLGVYFFYKKYSVHVLPYSLFVNFNTNDLRALFYLFFQHVRHRKILEWVWTCVPALILLLLLYPSLILLYCYDRPYITKPYLTFKAIGHQWYWSYEYSDFVTSTDASREHIKFDSYMLHEDDLDVGSFRLLEVDRRIVLPIGVCMRLITTSSDVLHSWAVPALGVKIDAVPGRLNQFWIVADRPGTFYGQCSELCGVNHGFMPIAVEAAAFLEFFKAVISAEQNT